MDVLLGRLGISVTYSAAEHVGLYSLFHRDARNKVLHWALVPVVMVTAMVFGSALATPWSLPLPGWDVPINITLLAVVMTVGSFLTISVAGALAFAAWIIPSMALTNHIVATVPVWQALLVAFVLQCAAWFGTVVIGHMRYEPTVDGGAAGPLDSNLYLKGWNRMRGFGREPSPVEAFTQFAISPLSNTLDLLFALGLCKGLEREIATVRERAAQRIREGRAPL